MTASKKAPGPTVVRGPAHVQIARGVFVERIFEPDEAACVGALLCVLGLGGGPTALTAPRDKVADAA
jgi:hypothetical protein